MSGEGALLRRLTEGKHSPWKGEVRRDLILGGFQRVRNRHNDPTSQQAREDERHVRLCLRQRGYDSTFVNTIMRRSRKVKTKKPQQPVYLKMKWHPSIDRRRLARVLRIMPGTQRRLNIRPAIAWSVHSSDFLKGYNRTWGATHATVAGGGQGNLLSTRQ